MKNVQQCLVAEDSFVMRQMLVKALEGLPGFEVVEAPNGLLALQAFAKQDFDIVMTDINMPLMDGLKLIGRIRNGSHNALVPIVVITTESAPVDRTKALKLGASAYLIKPIQAEHVVQTIKGLLGV